MMIELEDKNAKELLVYLLNLKKRAEFVIEKKEKYSTEAIERARRVVEIISPIINQLSEKTEKERGGKTLEERVKDLEDWKMLVEPVLKKLVAYHTGEI